MDTSFVRKLKTSRSLVVVETDGGKCIGGLEPIVDEHAADPSLVEQICKWHNDAIEFYTDREKWNCGLTAQWLRNSMIASERRVLFFVQGSHGERIGLCGLSEIGADEAQIYDILRGTPGGHPLLLPYAEIAMLRLCFSAVGVSVATGRVHRLNAAARRMGRFVGFEQCEQAGGAGPGASDEDARILLRITRDQLPTSIQV